MQKLFEVLKISFGEETPQCAPIARLAEILPVSSYYRAARALWSDQAFWRFLLPKRTGQRGCAVVLESRLGSVSLAMAPLFDTIVVVHTDTEVLELTRIRAGQSAMSNFCFIQLDRSLHLPFSTGSVAAVVLFDVEADVLCNNLHLDARSYNTLVREAARIAAADGAVIIGANNGDSYHWWKESLRRLITSKTNPHVPVPRLSTCLDLLKKEMFNNGDVFIGASSFNLISGAEPEFSNWNTPYRECHPEKGCVEGFRHLVLKSKPLLSRRPSFLIIRERRRFPTLLEELLMSDSFARDALRLSNGSRPLITRLISGNANTTIAMVKPTRGDGIQLVVRLPYDAEALERCETNVLALTVLRSSCLGDVIPRFVSGGTFEGQPYFIESLLHGAPVSCNGPDKKQNRTIISACERLAELQVSQARTVLPLKPFVLKRLDPWITTLANSNTVGPTEYGPCSNEILDLFERALDRTAFPFVPSHGDWKTGNLLFDRKRDLTGIIDWENYGNEGLPCTDFLLLLTYMLAKEESRSIMDVFIRSIAPWNVPEIFSKFVSNYLRLLGIDNRGFTLLRALFWIELVNTRFDPIQKGHHTWKKTVWIDLWPHFQKLMSDCAL